MKTNTFSVMFCTTPMDSPGGPHILEHPVLRIRKVSCIRSFLQNTHPESLIIQEAQNGLLPSHTYGVFPRGDPAHITSLTHQQLQEAHAKL
ncbi:hypothetical protein RRG08_066704 [Elysia crispata]|uniref:Uncharacterized protein n=1 Tax=Elysia crispata TaxID=231223 RepID=A0AAE1ALR8_9GAST|nr:hypothetical protein RRG08_066704 [Elysia crispata]